MLCQIEFPRYTPVFRGEVCLEILISNHSSPELFQLAAFFCAFSVQPFASFVVLEEGDAKLAMTESFALPIQEAPQT